MELCCPRGRSPQPVTHFVAKYVSDLGPSAVQIGIVLNDRNTTRFLSEWRVEFRSHPPGALHSLRQHHFADILPVQDLMVVLRCTQQLLFRRRQFDDAPAVRSTTRLGHWYGNLLRIGSRHVSLFISERSRPPALIPAREASRLQNGIAGRRLPGVDRAGSPGRCHGPGARRFRRSRSQGPAATAT
jgi:hypothetical protein